VLDVIGAASVVLSATVGPQRKQLTSATSHHPSPRDFFPRVRFTAREVASVLVHFDHIASRIVNVNHSILGRTAQIGLFWMYHSVGSSFLVVQMPN
jgi:hypothetical protein